MKFPVAAGGRSRANERNRMRREWHYQHPRSVLLPTPAGLFPVQLKPIAWREGSQAAPQVVERHVATCMPPSKGRRSRTGPPEDWLNKAHLEIVVHIYHRNVMQPRVHMCLEDAHPRSVVSSSGRSAHPLGGATMRHRPSPTIERPSLGIARAPRTLASHRGRGYIATTYQEGDRYSRAGLALRAYSSWRPPSSSAWVSLPRLGLTRLPDRVSTCLPTRSSSRVCSE